jgi:hypothetical protein
MFSGSRNRLAVLSLLGGTALLLELSQQTKRSFIPVSGLHAWIYSTQDNGSMASGCRAIECIRIFWDLANIPANLAAARVRISQGVLNSQLLGPEHKDSSAATQHSYVVSGTMPRNLIQVATREYVTKNGMGALIKAMHAMLDRAIA